MRFAVVSDIHGNLPALDAVLAAIARTGADLTLNLGDIVSGPLWPRETAARLMALDLPTLAGNHERQLLTQPRTSMGAADAHAAAQITPSQRAWLAQLPRELWLADGAVYACHGTPASDVTYWLETVTPGFVRGGERGVRMASADEARVRLDQRSDVQASLMLCGHTHQPRALQLGASLVVNPGSVGLQAYDDAHPHPHVVENGSPHARWALVERDAAGWSVTLNATAYDWEAAARQAERNARPDWADALRSGHVGRFEAEVVGPGPAPT